MKNRPFERIFQAGFLGLMLLFWVRFAYLGILLTKVHDVGQATTLYETQNLFVVQLIRVFLAAPSSVIATTKAVLNIIPYGYVVYSVVAMIIPEWKRLNRTINIASLGAQLLFPAALVITVNSSGTLGEGLARAQSIGWGLFCVGFVMLCVLVYSFVYFMYDMSRYRGEGND